MSYSDGVLPLDLAIKSTETCYCEQLIQHRADPNAHDPLSVLLSELYKSSSKSTSGWFQQIPPETVRTRAVASMIIMLIHAGADVNLMIAEGITPLAVAVQSCNELLAEALLNRGANFRSGGLLHVAVSRASELNLAERKQGKLQSLLRLTELLLASGSDVNATDCTGLTALDCAMNANLETRANLI